MNATIATRTHPRTGRTEYRAYPQGLESEDGGAGAWYADRAQAEGVLAAALAPASVAAAREAIEAHQAAAPGIDRSFAFGRRNRALDAMYADLTTREDGARLTELATDADLIDIAVGRATVELVNARRR